MRRVNRHAALDHEIEDCRCKIDMAAHRSAGRWSWFELKDSLLGSRIDLEISIYSAPSFFPTTYPVARYPGPSKSPQVMRGLRPSCGPCAEVRG